MRKSKEQKWQYDFDCKNCENIKKIGDCRYCAIMKVGIKCIHADDDRHVRADYYKPREVRM